MLEKIEEMAKELDEALAARAAIHEFLLGEHEDLNEELANIDQERFQLDERTDQVQVHLMEREPGACQDLEEAETLVGRLKSAIKRECYKISADDLVSGKKVAAGRVRVGISKVTPVVSYKSEQLVKDHPHIRDMSVDGDPVVRITVDPNVMARLIASGKVSEDIIEQYRETAKAKNPSVRIEEVDE